MPFKTIPDTTTEYALLSFDADGKERTDDPQGVGGRLSAAILERVRAAAPSHIFLFSHGWKGDVASATDQYNRWIKAMLDRPADLGAMPRPFAPMWIGLHWPSLPFGDEELEAASFAVGGGQSPDEIVATFRERLGLGADAEPLLRTIVDAHQRDAAATELPPDVAAAYVELATRLGYAADGPGAAPDAEGARFDPALVFDQGNAIDAAPASAAAAFIGGLLGRCASCPTGG